MAAAESSKWGLRSGAREVWTYVRDTFSDWSEDGAPRLAAALAYYTIFSLGPLLIVSIALAGIVFGREAVQGQVVAQLAGLIGPDSAEAIEDLIARAQRQPRPSSPRSSASRRCCSAPPASSRS